MPGAARMNPDRGAIGGEEPIRAMAEDFESRRQVQRRGEDAGELVEEEADVALKILGLTQPEQHQGGDEGVGGFDRIRGDVGG